MSQVPIYQLKVTLLDSKPPIWRRLLVSGDTTLPTLHQILQVAMGWEDAHLHQFYVGERRYSMPLEDLEVEDERRVKLRDLVLGEGFKFVYEYDFGDSWEHRVLVEKILSPDPTQPLPSFVTGKLPICIKGKQACPPEDVGGIWGYDTFLEALKDPSHPDHAMYREWIGGTFDPEAFHLDAVNARLSQWH